jgi:inner membrane protein
MNSLSFVFTVKREFLLATIFSHALVGATIVSGMSAPRRSTRNYILGAATAVVPDLDYFGFVNQVPYASLWGHRGISHSIVFAVAVGFIAMLAANRKIKFLSVDFFSLFFLTTISHALIDACTNGGLGVALFAPYNTHRYFFPWHPIEVSPMGLGFFSARGIAVLISEFSYIVIPCIVFVLVRKLAGKFRLVAP